MTTTASFLTPLALALAAGSTAAHAEEASVAVPEPSLETLDARTFTLAASDMAESKDD